MVAVENKNTLRLLARRFLKINKGRNVIVLIAIVLTTILFTSVLTASLSIIISTRNSDIRQQSDAANARVQDATSENYKKVLQAIKEDEDVANYGIGNYLGMAVNDKLAANLTEVRYGDANMIDSYLCTLDEGSIPKAENEIACSTITLDLLGIPHKVGEKVTITIDNSHQKVTDTFVLSGFWKGDRISKSQKIWVSQDYRDKICPEVTEQELSDKNNAGSYDIAVWYKNTWNLEEKTQALDAAADITGKNCTIAANQAYLLFVEDGFSFESVATVLLIIMLTGYLLIHNVFSISVNMDIRVYALLKNIGTSGKQLKKIVRMQALWLTAIGVPIGILAGFLITRCMMPVILTDADIIMNDGMVATTASSPLIFLFAAAFTVVTVYIGCARPCRVVGKLSPVEAIHCADGTKQEKRARKRNTGVTPFAMAFCNIRRTIGSGLAVMVSLALSLIALNTVYVTVRGYDFSEYMKAYMASDFSISQCTDTLSTSNLNGISPQLRSTLDECQASEQNSYIYYTASSHKIDAALEANMEKQLEACKEWQKEYKDWDGTYVFDQYEATLSAGQIKLHIMGLNKGAFSKLDFAGESCSWEDFSSGKYVIAGKSYYVPDVPNYNAKDKVTVEYSDSEQKEYEVLGTAEIAYAADYPFGDDQFITLFVPESEYIANTGNEYAMLALVDAKSGQEKQVDAYIENNIVSQNANLNVDSILKYRADFADYLNKIYLVGWLLTGVLALIGIMNFFNTSVTSVIARKRELSLLEVVGMSKKQIRQMLIIEGSVYLIGAFVMAAVVCLMASKQIVTAIVGLAFFFHIKTTIWPCVLTLPVLFLVAYLVPKYNYQKMRRESIVERIRHE